MSFNFIPIYVDILLSRTLLLECIIYVIFRQ